MVLARTPGAVLDRRHRRTLAVPLFGLAILWACFHWTLPFSRQGLFWWVTLRCLSSANRKPRKSFATVLKEGEARGHKGS